ncbi:hypothetical protein H0H92_007640 [Tricholoma furcatifolium]|nr:hypothetical protein H0H92_007640 [Tricholoma furcatifolium]
MEWADEIKGLHGAPYAWASDLHFVNAEAQDIEVTAIANYTSRLYDTSLNDVQRQEALKFLSLFV